MEEFIWICKYNKLVEIEIMSANLLHLRDIHTLSFGLLSRDISKCIHCICIDTKSVFVAIQAFKHDASIGQPLGSMNTQQFIKKTITSMY